MPSAGGQNGAVCPRVRFIPLLYSADDSIASAIRLVRTLRPEWAAEHIELVRFTDGITNTLLKAANRPPGSSKEAADADAVLLRAYGHGTDRIIDRQREAQNHELLSRHGLAPPLLARFENGMLYSFVRGSVPQPEDLRREPISRAIARRLAEWHAIVPCLPRQPPQSVGGNGSSNAVRPNGLTHNGGATGDHKGLQEKIDTIAPGKPAPNLWTVLQKWILALPTETEDQVKKQHTLQSELIKLVSELSGRPGLGKNGLVFAHTDLLSGNVIVLPRDSSVAKTTDITVHFIDYEYATPSPAAFDIANHFAEWGGFNCDYSMLPTRAERRAFIREYVQAYLSFPPADRTASDNDRFQEGIGGDQEEQIERLMAEVDLFRGVPGFYWGVWSLIQATISDIDFDYASYAEVRLGEYWAWRHDGDRAAKGEKMTLRESRWAQEE